MSGEDHLFPLRCNYKESVLYSTVTGRYSPVYLQKVANLCPTHRPHHQEENSKIYWKALWSLEMVNVSALAPYSRNLIFASSAALLAQGYPLDSSKSCMEA